VQTGFELRDSKRAVEKLGGAHLFPVTVSAGQAVDIEIEEATPIRKTIDIRTEEGIGAIELYLKKSHADPELEAKLRDIVKTYSAIADLDERMVVLADQMSVYRSRVDELNVQLVTLKKVAQAQKLSRHLSDKMQEISEKLQQTTIQMSDLKGQQMALRIELQDKLAELTLRPPKSEAASAGGSGAATSRVGGRVASGAS
jgi:chromosome segregation ATPase